VVEYTKDELDKKWWNMYLTAKSSAVDVLVRRLRSLQAQERETLDDLREAARFELEQNGQPN
jgi:DNA-binding response OmpR family regulator